MKFRWEEEKGRGRRGREERGFGWNTTNCSAGGGGRVGRCFENPIIKIKILLRSTMLRWRKDCRAKGKFRNKFGREKGGKAETGVGAKLGLPFEQIICLQKSWENLNVAISRSVKVTRHSVPCYGLALNERIKRFSIAITLLNAENRRLKLSNFLLIRSFLSSILELAAVKFYTYKFQQILVWFIFIYLFYDHFRLKTFPSPSSFFISLPFFFPLPDVADKFFFCHIFNFQFVFGFQNHKKL